MKLFNGYKPQNKLLAQGATMAARQWTPEQRAAQAKAIQAWQPWNQSTGAKTAQGKLTVSRNAYRGGSRPLCRFIGWFYRAIEHPETLTPEIVIAAKIRCTQLVGGNIAWLDKVNAKLTADYGDDGVTG